MNTNISSKDRNPWFEDIYSTPLTDALPDRSNKFKIITLSEDDKLIHALNTLQEHKIKCAPVTDHKGNPVCVLTVQNLCEHFVRHMPDHWTDTDDFKVLVDGLAEDKDSSNVLNDPLSKVIKESAGWTEWAPIALDTPVSAVAQFFASGLKHIVVVDPDGKPIEIMGQLDLIKFISRRSQDDEQYGEFGKRELDDLGCGHAPVASIGALTPMHKCLEKMREAHVSSLAITDQKTGRLISSLNSEDIRGVRNFAFLARPVQEFLEVTNPSSKDRVKHALTPADTLMNAVETFAQCGDHRVWEVNAAGQPIKCIALTDIYRVICSSV